MKLLLLSLFTLGSAAFAASLTSITPSVVAAQTSSASSVTIVGSGTSFQQGVTTASFPSCPKLTVVSLAITSPATANLTVDTSNFQAGSCKLALTTGSEIATDAILKVGYTTALAPGAVEQGANTTLTFTANDVNAPQFPGTTPSIDFGGADMQATSPPHGSTAQLQLPVSLSDTATVGSRIVQLNWGSTTYFANLTVKPGRSSITSVSPSTLAPGATADIDIQGELTHFSTGATTATFPGSSALTVQSVTVLDARHLTVHVSVSASALQGAQTLQITTGPEIVSASLQVLSKLTITPSQSESGRTLTLQISGAGTHFSQGTTSLLFASANDVAAPPVVNNLTVINSGLLSASLTIPNFLASVAWNVTVVTGSETSSGTFSVLYPVTASPSSVDQGTDVQMTFTYPAALAIASAKETTIDLGPGIQVSNIVAMDQTHLSASLYILDTATPGVRDVNVSQGTGEHLLGTAQVTVNPGQVKLLSVSPASILPGTSQTVTISGEMSAFRTGTVASFSNPGITVQSSTIVDGHTLIAQIAASATATPGLSTLTVTSGSQVLSLPGGLTVIGPLGLPTYLSAGATQDVPITASLTHFQQGVTTVSVDGATVTSVTVLSPTSLTANVTVPIQIGPVAHNITVATNSEKCLGSVLIQFPMKVTPDQIVGGTDVSLTFDASPTVLVDTPDVTETNLYRILTDPITITKLDSRRFKVTGPALNTLDTTTFQFTAHPGGGAIVNNINTHTTQYLLSAPVTITPGTLMLIGASPNAGLSSTTMDVAINAESTLFAGPVTVDFGSDVTVSSVHVIDRYTLSAHITIAANAVPGLRMVTATCHGISSSGSIFTILAQNAKADSLAPAIGILGGARNVVLTSASAHFGSSTTLAATGGVSIDAFQVINSTTINATLWIPTIATLGTQTLTASTPVTINTLSYNESRSADFTVVRAALYFGIGSANSGHQGQTVDVCLTAINLSQTITGNILDFGPDTTATPYGFAPLGCLQVHVAIAPTAALGPRDVLLRANSETTGLTQGFTVLP